MGQLGQDKYQPNAAHITTIKIDPRAEKLYSGDSLGQICIWQLK